MDLFPHLLTSDQKRSQVYPCIVIGSLIGALGAIGFISSSWQGPEAGKSAFAGLLSSLVAMAIILILGLFLFPRTIGMLFTPIVFVTPIAFLIGLFRHNLIFGLAQLLFGFIAWLITFTIAKFRPEAT